MTKRDEAIEKARVVMIRVPPKQAAFILRGLASSIVLRATDNNDVAGLVVTQLSRVADEIELTDALPNSEDLDAFIGKAGRASNGSRR